jgi:8-oxo-dGTP pyrophosphatase MutT (NUDIX family)
MKHSDRWDLPKGHVESGEKDRACALRELGEETGIQPSEIEVDEAFRFRTEYDVQYAADAPARKTLIIFLAKLTTSRHIEPTEHAGFRWFDWSPPHNIQTETIDSLLQTVSEHWRHVSAEPDENSDVG